ncbi:MAG: ATP-dependent DNA helicase [Caldilineaceae bacterium]|nr:ATP-dependent DNA helicase [Caldilineaceae bacterium]
MRAKLPAMKKSATPAEIFDTLSHEAPSETNVDPGMPELEACDLAEFFGPVGALARTLAGYELRASQLEMAEAVKRALLKRSHALVEAPTGTGKSLAYLLPALLSGRTVVVATANKALQRQLYEKDIPLLSRVLDRPIDAVVVKGRSNFICNLKWEKEAFEQERFTFVDREHAQITHLRTWLNETDSGDVDDLPFLLESDLRPRLVSFPDDCLQRDCPHFEDNCWINHMRDRAAEAQVLITNHHLLLNALELGWAGERILPPASIYIVDEAHQLEQTATAVFETTVSDFTVEQALNRSILREHVDEDRLDELRFQNTLAFQEVAHLSRDNSFRIETELEELKKLGHALEKLATELKSGNPFVGREPEASQADEQPPAQGVDAEAQHRRSYELMVETVSSAASKLLTVARSNRDDQYVRYAVRVFDRRHISLEVHAAPINPEALLSQVLFHPEDDDGPVARSVICTSATLATNRNFSHFKQRCGIQQSGEELVAPMVFDYPRQALLYQPALPAYDWRNAEAYYVAVANEIGRLLEVSRGRTLCLFTSWSGLQQVSDRLRRSSSSLIWPLRGQGDAPRGALLDWFRDTPHSVLLATRSFWEGVDIPGDDLSLVVLDKMPFPTPGDPLHSARMKAIEEQGRSSFGDYMAPLMTLALKQGFGRLIRRSTDLGVVAILDERLTSKPYGRQARQDLPPARFSRDFKEVHRFFQQALDSCAEFALNVWSTTNDSPTPKAERAGWRWQLLRLQDGKSDSQDGVLDQAVDLPGDQTLLSEIHAILDGLENLRRRIELAGHRADQYCVEVRCQPATTERLHEEDAVDPLWRTWDEMRSRWKDVNLIAVDQDNEPTEDGRPDEIM